jgi:hypothetical protein
MSLEGVVDKLVLPNNILKIQPAWSRSNGNIHAMIRVAAFFFIKVGTNTLAAGQSIKASCSVITS